MKSIGKNSEGENKKTKKAWKPKPVSWSGDIHILRFLCMYYGWWAETPRASRALTLLHRVTHHAALPTLSVVLLSCTLLALHLHSCPLHWHTPTNYIKIQVLKLCKFYLTNKIHIFSPHEHINERDQLHKTIQWQKKLNTTMFIMSKSDLFFL